MTFTRLPAVALLLAIAPLCAMSQTFDVSIDQRALQRVIHAADSTHSDALVVWKDGRPVGAWYFGKTPRKLAAMSATKSIVNLAIGRLVTVGAIRSIDDSVWKYYPEWRQGLKKTITLREILGHTSGLQDDCNNAVEVERAPDAVRLALAAELQDRPGTRFCYSNKAVNLLSGIVEHVTHKRMDVFLRQDLFTAMGITDFDWSSDSAGHAYAYAGLTIRASDLAKLGQLTLDRGRWGTQQLVRPDWFDESLRGSPLDPHAGLLWWLVPDRRTWVIDDEQISLLRTSWVDTAFLHMVSGMRGRYPNLSDWTAALRRTFGPTFWEPVAVGLASTRMELARVEYGQMIGYEANGYLGQYLVIYPDQRLVAVRMIAASHAHPPEDSFEDFPDLVRALVPAS